MEECKTTEESGKIAENAKEEQEYTETLYGAIMLRKGRLEEQNVWYATVGYQLVSDGAFKTKQELIENIENVTLERICKIVAGAFDRAISLSKSKQQ